MFGGKEVIAQGNDIHDFQRAVQPGLFHKGCPLGKGAELGHSHGFSAGISQLLGQQQEALLPGIQRKRFLITGWVTVCSVSDPSAPRSMGRIW